MKLMENILRETWQAFSPPTEEVNVVGNWYAVIYKGKRAVTLFIAKANKRFLKDENRTVDKLLMTFLKPKVGPGNILEETPKHLPPDQGMFDPWDVIHGPLKVIYQGSNKFMIPAYKKVKGIFESVKIIDRETLFTLS